MSRACLIAAEARTELQSHADRNGLAWRRAPGFSQHHAYIPKTCAAQHTPTALARHTTPTIPRDRFSQRNAQECTATCPQGLGLEAVRRRRRRRAVQLSATRSSVQRHPRELHPLRRPWHQRRRLRSVDIRPNVSGAFPPLICHATTPSPSSSLRTRSRTGSRLTRTPPHAGHTSTAAQRQVASAVVTR